MTDEGTSLRILRTLAERPDGAITSELIGVFGREIPKQQGQSWAGQHLRRLAADGKIVTRGRRYGQGNKKRHPSAVWHITELGLAAIRYADEAPILPADSWARSWALRRGGAIFMQPSSGCSPAMPPSPTATWRNWPSLTSI